MKINVSEKAVSGILLVIFLTVLPQVMCFCQDKQNPGQKTHGKPNPPSTEERMKSIQEKVIKPLALNSSQNEALTKAYSEFFTGMENLKKTMPDSQGPLDKSKVEPLKKARDDKIRKVLSSAQFSKYQELEKASRPPKPAGNETKKN